MVLIMMVNQFFAFSCFVFLNPRMQAFSVSYNHIDRDIKPQIFQELLLVH